MRHTGVFKRRMEAHFPVRAAEEWLSIDLGIEDQARLPAALVAESFLAEIPEQDGDRVFALVEELGEIHAVEVGVAGRRAALELAFEDGELSIDPQPVFRIGGDAGDGRSRVLFQIDRGPEASPLVCVLVSLGSVFL